MVLVLAQWSLISALPHVASSPGRVQTDKQTNRQTDKQTNRQTDKQTNRQTDKQTVDSGRNCFPSRAGTEINATEENGMAGASSPGRLPHVAIVNRARTRYRRIVELGRNRRNDRAAGLVRSFNVRPQKPISAVHEQK